MIFDWLNVGSPFFWCFVGSILLGGAVSRTSRTSLGRERWTLIYLYLTAAIAAAVAGIFIPGPSHFLDVRLAYFSVVCAGLGFVGFRFAVAVGVPLVLLGIVAIAVFGISLRGWLPLQGQQQEIGRIHVFDAAATQVNLEVSPSGENGRGSVAGTLPAGDIAPVVEALRFSSYYFFLASPIIYRFDGVTVSDSTTPPAELPLVQSTTGAPRLVSHLPGINYETIHGAAARPRTLQDYTVILESALEAHLIEAQS